MSDSIKDIKKDSKKIKKKKEDNNGEKKELKSKKKDSKSHLKPQNNKKEDNYDTKKEKYNSKFHEPTDSHKKTKKTHTHKHKLEHKKEDLFGSSEYELTSEDLHSESSEEIVVVDGETVPKGNPAAKKEAKKRKKKRRQKRKVARHAGRAKPAVLEHKKNVLGEIIYKGHPSWILMLNIQTGIRNSVGNQKIKQISDNYILSESELFKCSPVLPFPPGGSQYTVSHTTGTFKFKDYCPEAFKGLRAHFGIDPAEYLKSVCDTRREDGENALREMATPGKSGALFFFSSDMKYILKTIPKKEAKLLLDLMPEYYKHVMQNRHTLLPRFFGLYRIKPHKGAEVRFIVMANIFVTNLRIDEKYDLKGSTAGRCVTEEEKKSKSPTYKDLDFIDCERKIHLGDKRRRQFLKQLRKDCDLLGRVAVMDYSLLIGIHLSQNDSSSEESSFGSDGQSSLSPKKKKKTKKSKSARSKPSQSSEDKKKKKKKKKKVTKLKKITNSKESQESQSSSELKLEKKSKKSKSKKSKSKKKIKSKKKSSSRNTRVDLTASKKLKLYEAGITKFMLDDGGMKGVDKDGNFNGEHYFIGVIDILMTYTVIKQFEHTYKSYKFGPEEEVSSVHPTQYAERFYNFAENVVIV